MKFFKNSFLSFAALVMTMTPFLNSCEKDEVKPAKAVMVSVSYMTFEAENPGEQLVTVYADGKWSVEAPEWLSITPSEGVGSLDVSIAATPNMDGNEVDKPREVELVFKGEKLMSHCSVHVKQVGDKFRGMDYSRLGDLSKLEDQSLVKIKEAQVVAKSLKGIVLSDGTANVYVSTEEGKVGDKFEMWGTKTTLNGVPSIESLEKIKLLSAGSEVILPEAKDITQEFDRYQSAQTTFIAVEGVFNGSRVSVPNNKLSLVLMAPLPEFDLKEMFAHKILIKGYYVGKDESCLYMVVTSIQDNGEVPRIVWFKDDFSWLKTYEEAWNKANPSKKVGDSVGADKSSQAPNIANPNDKVFGPMDFWSDFNQRGYDDIVGHSTGGGPHNSIYIQTYYLKFSRTDVHNGLKLVKPVPSTYNGQDVNLQFDWCAHCDNNKPADDIQLVIEIVGDGQILSNGKKVSEPIFHSQSKSHTEFFWQKASVTLTGLSTSSKIFIRPLNYLKDSPNRQRWYIDNIVLDSYDM